MVISISAVLLGVAKVLCFFIFSAFWWFCCFYTDCPRSRGEDNFSFAIFALGMAAVMYFLLFTGEVVDFVTSIKFVA